MREVNSSLAIIRKQTLENDNAFEVVLKYQLHGLTVMDLEARDELRDSLERLIEAHDRHLRATKTKLEGVRDSLRNVIDMRTRPNLRPLNIPDLPDELLMRIFECLGRDDFHEETYFVLGRLGNVDNIENVRLTCRRFCDTSSHLLLRSLQVDITEPASLEHLEVVANHPSISKGIRTVEVVLKYYSLAQAENIQLFAACQASKMAHTLEVWHWWDVERLDSPSTPIHTGSAIAEARPILESWQQVAERGIEAEGDESPRTLLRRAHDEYRRRYNEWSTLCDGGLLRAAFSAFET